MRSRPSSSIDSNSGGEMRRPVTATRTGPNATLGLRPSPSTSAARSAASIEAWSNGSSAGERVVRRLQRGPRVVGEHPLAVLGVDRERGLVDEQEAQLLGARAQRLHPLLHERHGGVDDAPAARRVGVAVDRADGVEVGHAAGGRGRRR